MIQLNNRNLDQFGSALSLVTEIQRQMEIGSSISLRGNHVCLKGTLNLNHRDLLQDGVLARIELAVPPNWITVSPACNAFEYWIKEHDDWHVGKSGELCWVLPQEWKAELAVVSDSDNTPSSLKKFSSYWMLRNIKYLLTCHYLGNDLGLEDWPKQWPQYAHDQEGLIQFYKIQRKREKKRRKSTLNG